MKTAERLATRLMCDCFEKKLVTSTGVITWTDEFIAHAASMFDDLISVLEIIDDLNTDATIGDIVQAALLKARGEHYDTDLDQMIHEHKEARDAKD